MARETSGFGPRIDPKSGKPAQHNGVDYAAPVGSPVYVSRPMTVVSIGEQSGYGNVIETRDAAGVRYIFAHMDGFPPDLKKGDSLNPGAVVGYTGNSGKSTGAHLHYETRMFDSATGRYKAFDPVTTIDPTTGRPYINNASFSPGSTPSNSSLRSSTPTVDPGYRPSNNPDTRSLNNEIERLLNRKPAPLPGASRGQRAPGTDAQYRGAGVLVNPVLKLGDELID